ncbi:hypothetical protein LTR05_000773 [Lithohypha guttulata]|uniref:Major facilitator superfamily (MFS) profile domain-containing protein n=1 Tax=Lithohypha guttulata TaxID=1690604 RepID=A0AAN7T519_9EURO|nr:hypothetical protein LTR05_000773 [Lithohypha guttulata]
MSQNRSRSPSLNRHNDDTQTQHTTLKQETRDSMDKNVALDSYEMQDSRSQSPLPRSSQTSDKKIMEEKLQPEDDEIEYPHGIKLAIISASLCLAVFLMALDNTIIATAIPKITDQFKSLDDIGWYASSYLLTTCALQLFFGKIYTFYSIKWTFLVSIGIFEVGSAICGAAPSSTALIIGRAVAGVGSAGLFGGALTIIAYTVPMSKRPAYTGIIGAMYGIASVAGPLLGGAFTDGPGWRWCFYINLPLGAITCLAIGLLFKSPTRKLEAKVPFTQRVKQLDLVGTSLFITGIVVVLLALQWGGTKYPWSDWRIILLFVLFGIITIVFIGLQWYLKDNATLPFRIISQRSVAAACVWASLLGAAFFILIYWVPIWFQAVKGATAFKSGIYCLPMILALVIANAICGAGTTVIGYYNPFYYASVVLSCIGAGLLTTWTVDVSSGKWIGYPIIYGFGVGFGMQQAIITVQAVLPLKDIPVGTAMAAFFMNFGGSLFVSVGQNVFNNRLTAELAKFTTGIDPSIIIHVGATEIKHVVPPSQLDGVLTAYNNSLTQTWYIAVAMCCLTVFPAIFVEWKSVKGMKGLGGAA